MHSALGIKPGAKINGLGDEAKASLERKLSEVNLLMIGKISMVSSDLWTEVPGFLKSFRQILSYHLLVGLSVVVTGGYLHIPPVKGWIIYSIYTGEVRQNNYYHYS